MLFNSFEYVAFFLVVYTLYWALAHHARYAIGLLLGASLLFYGCWKPYYLILIINSSLVDFFTGRKISETEDPQLRRKLLWLSVIYNLGVLGIFKYFNFFMESFDDLVTYFELWDSFIVGGLYLPGGRLSALLPVGISFFTFQSMSYTIDIYRGDLKPVKRFSNYLLFVSFFPQLVAGPIVRARDLLPQLLQRPSVSSEMSGRGLYLISLGLFKKIAIADYLAINLVDRVFTTPDGYSSLECLLGVYGYALQIYCDFSGYSDIAIGSALLLGFQFPENFRTPYQSKNLQEFWRRWHISLSSWLRDYLYISLGGNRLGTTRTYFNLLMTMVLGGLWHGAGWNFIIWGILHGGALALHRYWHEHYAEVKWYQKVKDSAGWRYVSLWTTFNYVCLAWIFFRAPTFSEATKVISKLFEWTTSTAQINSHLWLVLIGGMIAHSVSKSQFEKVILRFARLPSFAQATLLFGFALLLRQLAVSEVVPFIYFQF